MKNAYELWLSKADGKEVLYQTSPRYAPMPNIKPKGCYAVALTQVMARLFDVPWGYDESMEFFRRELNDADVDVDNEMFVGDAQNLVDDLVGKGKVLYIPRFIPPNEPCPDDVLQFGRWHKTGNTYFHFTFCNGKGVTLIDPWSPEGSDSVREGFLMDWRGFKLL